MAQVSTPRRLPHPAATLAVPSYAPDSLVNQPFFSSLPDGKRLYALRGKQGTGKTQAIREFASEHPLRTLVLTHRVALAGTMASTFSIQDYKNLKARKLANHSGSLALVVNSLPRLNIEQYEGGILIIDEVTQLLAHLFSETMDGSLGIVLQKLSSLLQEAHHVLVADADLDDATLHLLQTLMEAKRHEMYFVENAYTKPGRSAILYASEDAFIEAIRQQFKDGARFAVATDTRKQCKHIASVLSQVDASRKVLAVHGDNSHSKSIRKSMRNPSTALQGYDAFVYSPSCFTGLDISMSHFDTVFLHVQGDKYSPTDWLQGLQRVRSPNSGTVHIHCKTRPMKAPTCPSTILGALEVDMARFVSLFDYDKAAGASRLRPIYQPFFDHLAISKAHRNQQLRTPQQSLERLLAAHGYHVQRVGTRQRHSGALKQASDDVQRLRIEELLAAPTVGPKQAAKLRSQPDVNAAVLERHDYEMKLGVTCEAELAEVVEATVDDWLWRLQRLRLLMLSDAELDDHLVARVGASSNLAAAAAEHAGLRLEKRLLAAAGGFRPGTELRNSDLLHLGELAMQHRSDVERLLHFRPNRQGANEPGRVWRQLMKRYGPVLDAARKNRGLTTWTLNARRWKILMRMLHHAHAVGAIT